jgi:hypothetical protein
MSKQIPLNLFTINSRFNIPNHLFRLLLRQQFVAAVSAQFVTKRDNVPLLRFVSPKVRTPALRAYQPARRSC